MTTELTLPRTSSLITHTIPGRGGSGRWLLRKLLRNKMALLGILILLGITIFAIFPSQFAPHNPIQVNLRARFTPPLWMEKGSWEYPLGADQLGRDILSRIIFGARVSLTVGVTAVLLSGLIGILLGLISGFVGGVVDNIVMGLAEIQLAFPYILLAIAIIAVMGPGLQNLILVLALSGWMIYAKLIRADVLSLRELDYVLAARSIGCSTPRIMLRHVLPQLVGPVIVVATLEMARIVVLESALSFLGLGVQSPELSWGQMLSDGRDYLETGWWVATFSGMAIMLAVLGTNTVGDWLSEIFDPTLRNQP